MVNVSWKGLLCLDTEEVANIMQTTGPLPIFVQQSAVAKAIG